MTILLFINASNILLSMLFNLLLANITILLCFAFLFLVVFDNFFIIPVDIKNARLTLALIIPTGAPITVANDEIEMLKQLMTCQNSQKRVIYLLTLLLIFL